MKAINTHIDQIKKICASNNVKTLFAFGSVTNNKLKKHSDIDLVIEIDEEDPFSYSDSYFKIKFELEKILDREIDLLEYKSIKNPYLKEQVDNTKVAVYEK
jgi:hypothetical protein